MPTVPQSKTAEMLDTLAFFHDKLKEDNDLNPEEKAELLSSINTMGRQLLAQVEHGDMPEQWVLQMNVLFADNFRSSGMVEVDPAAQNPEKNYAIAEKLQSLAAKYGMDGSAASALFADIAEAVRTGRPVNNAVIASAQAQLSQVEAKDAKVSYKETMAALTAGVGFLAAQSPAGLEWSRLLTAVGGYLPGSIAASVDMTDFGWKSTQAELPGQERGQGAGRDPFA